MSEEKEDLRKAECEKHPKCKGCSFGKSCNEEVDNIKLYLIKYIRAAYGNIK